ncbi:DUF1203 domain-containing protein [Kaistia granuli]|uniref:DUF1203 domain-containing protein n=1 Tax=Kaistia granuli TaxID=363259 RepID=UPI00037871AA|nr:DUF1203 domain-containing protein [Kaistia granuli]
MPAIRYVAIPSRVAAHYRGGGADANGQTAERRISDGQGVPCRHCLRTVPAGAAYLILAHRPFETVNPYAELGPIFLCANACVRCEPSDASPPMLTSAAYIIRGYSTDERIVYGSGKVVPRAAIGDEAGELLARDDIAFVHLRSSTNNCFQCRIERG